MGVLYSIVPLDEQIADYLLTLDVELPSHEIPARNPTPRELRLVCNDLTDLKVTQHLSPEDAGQITFEGLKDPENEPWTLLNVTDFNGDESLPHAIWFEKGWPSLILRIVCKLAAYCGPLVIVPDTGCKPIVVSESDDVAILFATWEHTFGADS